MSLCLDKSAWKRVALRDVVRHLTDRVDPETSGLERFLAGEHIPSDDLAITSWGVIGQDPIGPMFYKRFKPGHVLYVSRRTYLRKVAVPEFEGITGEKTFVLESLDSSVLLQELLPFILSTEQFHSYAIRNSRGSVNPYLNWGELAAYEFDLPPVDEQKRLADLLWSIERHWRSLGTLSEELAAQLSAGRNREFERLAFAVGVQSVTKVADIAAGSAFAHRFQGQPTGEYPFVKVSDLGDGDEVASAANWITEPVRREMKAKVWPAGTVVFPKVGAALLTERRRRLGVAACFDNNIMGLVPKAGLDPRFLLEFMRTISLSAFAQVGVIPSVNNSHIKALQIPRASPGDQAETLTRLGAFSKALEESKSERSALANVRSALLAEVFGGYN